MYTLYLLMISPSNLGVPATRKWKYMLLAASSLLPVAGPGSGGGKFLQEPVLSECAKL